MRLDAYLRFAAQLLAIVTCLLGGIRMVVGFWSGPSSQLFDNEVGGEGVLGGACLLLAGLALWLQSRRPCAPAGVACAAFSSGLAMIAPRGMFFAPGLAANGSLSAGLVLLLGSAAVGSLAQRKGRGRWPVSAWLAHLLIAVAAAAFVARHFQPFAAAVPSIHIDPLTALALIFLGAGTLLARPEDKVVRLFFEKGATGVLARSLFLGTVIIPLTLCLVLFIAVQIQWLTLANGVILLCAGLVLCGFTIALFSMGTAVAIHERKEEAEQDRLLLTARLQEQAAELQNAVGQRTCELQEANANLRRIAGSNALLALVAEHAPAGVVIADAQGRVEWVNSAFTRITGYSLQDAKGRDPNKLLAGAGTDHHTLDSLHQARLRGESFRASMLNYTKDGRSFWGSLDQQPVRDAGGHPINFVFFLVDITDERAASQRLIALNSRLGLATRSAALGVWEWDARAKRAEWDARTLEIYGLTPEQHSGTQEEWITRLHPDDRERMVRVFRRLAVDDTSEFEHEYRIIRATDGAVRLLHSRAIVQRDSSGGLVKVTGTERDITAERDTAHRTQVLTERLQLALRSTNYGVWEFDLGTNRLEWDEQMFAIYGISAADFHGSREIWKQCLHPEDRERAFDYAARVVAGEFASYELEFRIIRPDGSQRHVEAHAYLQRDPDGKPIRLVGLNRDITDRRALEERVRRSEALAREVSSIAQIGGWEYDVTNSQIVWTEGLRAIHEVPADFQPTLENTRAFYPDDPFDTWASHAHPQDSLFALGFDREIRLRTSTGRERWVRLIGHADCDPEGRLVRLHGTMQDVTARHDGERARRELEAQLFQAQKMETLGTLAGGIAHDFNNILTGIIGYHELAADMLSEDHPARACLNEARGSGLRARELVQQILTFGRAPSGGDHVVLDLALVAAEAQRFLRSTLPSSIDIDLQLAPELPPVRGNATQIHQVLLNLGSNASHAMRPRGGKLTIAVEPCSVPSELALRLGVTGSQSCVRLSVSDTGHGMDEATCRRIFDPFFTTKGTGEGTGLGLAVVHGIVRAHQGSIEVQSQPGAGTTFHIYLPGAEPSEATQEEAPVSGARGAGEHVYVVDDEKVVGNCTRLVLESKGYAVTVFASAADCLAAFRREPGRCALLLTDQTMPGMQGTELIAVARELVPDLPVVLMSGYFSKITPAQLSELGQIELLAKPFSGADLMAAMHRAMHARMRLSEQAGALIT